LKTVVKEQIRHGPPGVAGLGVDVREPMVKEKNNRYTTVAMHTSKKCSVLINGTHKHKEKRKTKNSWSIKEKHTERVGADQKQNKQSS